MRKKMKMLGILAVVIGAVGIVTFGTDRSEAVAAPGACPAMGATALYAVVAGCPVLSARMADAAQGRCPVMQDRDERSACPAQKAKPACPALQQKNEAKESRQVDYRKMA